MVSEIQAWQLPPELPLRLQGVGIASRLNHQLPQMACAAQTLPLIDRGSSAIDSRERDESHGIAQTHLHERVRPRLGQIQETRVCSRYDFARDRLRR